MEAQPEMITIIVPEWLVYVIIGMFFVQWFMNGALIFYKNRNTKAYEKLDEWTKKVLAHRSQK